MILYAVQYGAHDGANLRFCGANANDDSPKTRMLRAMHNAKQYSYSRLYVHTVDCSWLLVLRVYGFINYNHRKSRS